MLKQPYWMPLIVLVLGCSAPRERVEPVLEDRAGIETAVLPTLPDFLDPRFRWTFRPTREITTVRAGRDQPLVYDPRALVVLSNASLLVHDPTADLVFALIDSSGTSVLHRFGRKGQGPGELGSWLSVREFQGTISILDARNRQLHGYSLDGQSLGSEPIDASGSGGKSLPAPNGGFLSEMLHVAENEWYRALVRVDDEGGVTSVARLPGPSEFAEPGRIQRGRVVWTVVGTHIVGMWSDRPRVVIYEAGGSVVRELELPLTRRELTARDIADQIEEHGAIARSLQPGPAALTNELYPVGDSIFGMFTTQLWKAEGDPDLGPSGVWWRLFTVRGEYIGVVELPADFWPLGPSPRGTWARVLNASGEPVVQELELVREDSGGNPSA